MTFVTRAKIGARNSEEVHIEEVKVPDLWHLCEQLDKMGANYASKQILECWYLCHDLLRHIKENR